MRKIFSLIALVLFSLTAHAQLGIHVGGNMSFAKPNFAPPADQLVYDYGMAGGFQVGVSYDVGSVFIFQPALFFQQKGASAHLYYPASQEHVDSRMNLNYLELPLNLMVKLKASDQVKIFFGVGVTGSMLLWSKSTFKEESLSWKEARKTRSWSPFTKENFEVGVQGFVGVQVFRFTATVNYNHSLLGNYVNYFGDKNNYLSINFGYRIGRDKERKKEK